MDHRKFAEIILPVIKNQPKSIAEICEKLGKTKTTIDTYIRICRNRGHKIKMTKRKGGSTYHYIDKPILEAETYKDINHIDNKLSGKTKAIQKTLMDRLGFSISTQQALLYGLHLADQKLNPDEFND